MARILVILRKSTNMVMTIKKGSTLTKIKQILRHYPGKVKLIDLKKFCGIIKLSEDPLVFQKAARNEW